MESESELQKSSANFAVEIEGKVAELIPKLVTESMWEEVEAVVRTANTLTYNLRVIGTDAMLH